MTLKEVNELDHGLYVIFWKADAGGGFSLAAVGSLHNGDRWLAPVNWTSPKEMNFDASHWEEVEKAELILSKKMILNHQQ